VAHTGVVAVVSKRPQVGEADADPARPQMLRVDIPPVRNPAVAGTIGGTALVAVGLPHYGLLVVFGAYVLSYLRPQTSEV
jgi:hypothetical protein